MKVIIDFELVRPHGFKDAIVNGDTVCEQIWETLNETFAIDIESVEIVMEPMQVEP